MGRSYWFECSRCGYRAVVSGKADKGLEVAVQTVVCRECKQLYDVVSRLRIPDETGLQPLVKRPRRAGLRPLSGLPPGFDPVRPPAFPQVLNRLPYTGVKRFRWFRFKAICPVSPLHPVEPWNAPGRCPRCGVVLDQNALPYRLWD